MNEQERKAALLGPDDGMAGAAAAADRARRKKRKRRNGKRNGKPKTFADAARIVQMAKKFGSKTIQNMTHPQLGPRYAQYLAKQNGFSSYIV